MPVYDDVGPATGYAALMSRQCVTRTVRLRVAVLRTGLVLPMIGCWLSGCAMMGAPKPVTCQPVASTPAFVLRQATDQAYAAGFAAGKLVQARRDRANAAVEANKAAAQAETVQEIPPQETPATGLAPAQTTRTQGPPTVAVAPALPPVPPVPGKNGYVPSGPATPLGSMSAPF
jgi:hypothetical protein